MTASNQAYKSPAAHRISSKWSCCILGPRPLLKIQVKRTTGVFQTCRKCVVTLFMCEVALDMHSALANAL